MIRMHELISPFVIMSINVSDGGVQSEILPGINGVFVCTSLVVAVQSALSDHAVIAFNSISAFVLAGPPSTEFAQQYVYKFYLPLFGGNTIEAAAPSSGNMEGFLSGYYHATG